MIVKTKLLFVQLFFLFGVFQFLPLKADLLKDEVREILNKELLNVSRVGLLRKVQELLAQGIWVDIRDKDGNSALMWAVDRNNFEIVKTLIFHLLVWSENPRFENLGMRYQLCIGVGAKIRI